jgi:hypothetical protein
VHEHPETDPSLIGLWFGDPGCGCGAVVPRHALIATDLLPKFAGSVNGL